jgi:hypothetical protein
MTLTNCQQCALTQHIQMSLSCPNTCKHYHRAAVERVVDTWKTRGLFGLKPSTHSKSSSGSSSSSHGKRNHSSHTSSHKASSTAVAAISTPEQPDIPWDAAGLSSPSADILEQVHIFTSLRLYNFVHPYTATNCTTVLLVWIVPAYISNCYT